MQDDRSRSLASNDDQTSTAAKRLDTPVPTSGVVVRAEPIPQLQPPRLAPPRPRPRSPTSTPPPVPPSSPARLALARQEVEEIPEYDGPIEEQPAGEPAPVAAADTAQPPSAPAAAVVEPSADPGGEPESFRGGVLASKKQIFWFVASAVVVVLVGLLLLFRD
jgi:hypothetical protein